LSRPDADRSHSASMLSLSRIRPSGRHFSVFRRAPHPVVRYLAHIAPACFISALLGYFGLGPFEWQYWGWLAGFAALELARDVAGARK